MAKTLRADGRQNRTMDAPERRLALNPLTITSSSIAGSGRRRLDARFGPAVAARERAEEARAGVVYDRHDPVDAAVADRIAVVKRDQLDSSLFDVLVVQFDLHAGAKLAAGIVQTAQSLESAFGAAIRRDSSARLIEM
jgi:hypothetical protein